VILRYQDTAPPLASTSHHTTVARTLPYRIAGGGIAVAGDAGGHLYADVSTRGRDTGPVVRVMGSDPDRADTVTWLSKGSHAGGPIRIWLDWDGWAVGADGRMLVVRNQDEYRIDCRA